jgi:hypothetical protein
LTVLFICVWVAIHPRLRSITVIYHMASAKWWAREDIYWGPGGLNYLPHFAILFTPFHALPVPVGDIGWRLLTAGLLASGIWRLLRDGFPTDTLPAFSLASLLALPASAGAMRSGQGSAVFAALTLHAAASLPRQRWWTAAGMMVLATAVRPLGVVMMLLSPFVYRKLRWRLVPWLILAAAFPFLFGPPAYVIAQYRNFALDMRECAVWTRREFADFSGVIRTFHQELPAGASMIVRVLAGAATLAIWRFTAPRIREPFRALWLLALTTGYLMLFNPMNEVNSYVIFVPVVAIWAVYCLRNDETRPLGYWAMFVALTIGVLPEPLRPLLGNTFGPFWHPIATAIFLGLATAWLWRPRPAFAETGDLAR